MQTDMRRGPSSSLASSSTHALSMAESLGMGAPSSPGNKSPVGHLDRKLSYTGRVPQRSTVVESPSGKTAVSSGPTPMEVKYRNGLSPATRPSAGVMVQSKQGPPVRQSSGDSSQNSPPAAQHHPQGYEQAPRPDFKPREQPIKNRR